MPREPQISAGILAFRRRPELEVLLGHPDVAECGVVGVPDQARGQIAEKVHGEHFVPLCLKLLQSSPQQWNSLMKIILTEVPLTS